MIKKLFEEINLDKENRLKELREYELITENISVFDDEQSYDYQIGIVLKSLLPMIYAHWEGFVKGALKKVFTYLNNQKLTSLDLSYTYLTIAYEQTLDSLEETKEFDRRKKHLTNLCDKFNENIKFKDSIDTKSNLKFSVLTEICLKLKLNITNLDKYNDKLKNEYNIKLDDLVNERNNIVHGDNAISFKSFDEIEKYINFCDDLMRDFIQELSTLINNKNYLKDNND